MSTAATEPCNALEFQLQQIWEDLLDCGPIGMDEDFFELGGESVMAMTLLARIAKTTGYQLPVAGMLKAPTIRQLAQSLTSQCTEEDWSPLVPLRTKGSRAPFYCVHPAGGNVLCYLKLAQYFDDDQPIYGLQPAGIDGVREPLGVVEEMAAAYVDAIRSHQPEGPYALGGWSFGGIVAYEMAQQLRAAGQEISTLAMIDAGVLYAFAVLRTVMPESDLGIYDLLRLPSEERVQEFRDRTADAKLIPDDADHELAERIFTLFTANLNATLNYRPETYDGKIVLLEASEAFVQTRHTPQKDWNALCQEVEVHQVPGNHLTMVHEPHVAELASTLNACLANQNETAIGRRKPR